MNRYNCEVIKEDNVGVSEHAFNGFVEICWELTNKDDKGVVLNTVDARKFAADIISMCDSMDNKRKRV